MIRMKLSGVELRRIRIPLVSPFRTSFATETEREVLLVRVLGAETEGWGECVAATEPLYSPEYVDGAEVSVETTIADADGKIVAKDSKPLTLAPGSREIRLSLTISHPHRWQGRDGPYLYTTTTRVLRDGKAVDAVVQPLGLRTVAITEADGFLLNGKPCALHGVNRHQDWRDKGWALADADTVVYGHAAGITLGDDLAVGDLDGDGRAEVGVGATGESLAGDDAGAAYVFWGGAR